MLLLLSIEFFSNYFIMNMYLDSLKLLVTIVIYCHGDGECVFSG